MARQSWLDEETQEVRIDEYTQQLGSFIDTLADGRVDADELAAQETRLVKTMQEVEPALDDDGKPTGALKPRRRTVVRWGRG